MAGDDDREQDVRPSEQRGGANPTDAEAREKGEWVETAKEGIVPAELGGSDAPDEMLSDEDPGYSDAALGRTTGSDEPATDAGIDPAAGDNADATRDGGPEISPGAEPDTKDVAAAAQRPDEGSAGG
jgi:hypothetical protein